MENTARPGVMHQEPQGASVFARHPVLTILMIWTVSAAMLGTTAELLLRRIGLGTPVLYQTSADYGYRPRPNQTVHRLRGAVVHVNNLGLRATSDWDSLPAKKILFLGNSVTFGGSYVSNADLFALRAPPAGWTGGSGGVNGWGVENIYGLVVKEHFLPAQIYVSVLIDADFYRGLSVKPAAFHETPPRLALIEVMPHVSDQIEEWWSQHFGGPEAEPDSMDAAAAVGKLRQLDDYLHANGCIHLIYLSPTQTNVLGKDQPDATVARLLAHSGLHVSRLLDRPELRGLDSTTISHLYHDNVHLEKPGHELWARIIGQDLQPLVDSLSGSSRCGSPRGVPPG